MSETSSTLSKRSRTPIFLALCLVAVSIAFPVVFIGSSAFRSKADYLLNPFGLPESLTLENFVALWNNYGIGRALGNSLTVIAVALTLQLLIAGLAGFAMAKLPVPGVKYIRAGFVLVMLVPGQVLIIPTYLLLSNLGLVGSLQGLMLVYIATGMPFAVFFLSVTFRTLDANVLEAARIDGAGFWRTFLSVAVPMGIPGIATLAVLQFLAMWNELLFAYILLPNDQLRLLTPALAQIGGRFTSDQTLVSAGLIISSLPPLILLALASRYVMSGLGASLGR
ncbi:carbohydrate ABC transporter membrane protein 2 (CUT1 family) [Labedella gwakjiensis]|uniref:Carbohydrate ABC transporter membrane protein 2 (CUT1 family) n=1 Tax=Labedella gwakjiensis TaxID=390269 RepID=A0A2P8GVZ4_9MICO|nr:carbohydrate ABC transporter permease [Labedella gwakjiensis]PSL38132.1 carbohydrate ABC transporter membrane protein 2 (CUT1 family) [Labedella gwakjiensis]RUQ87318.1 carbohydrate ABC transporter permease [Labedella gwakjiensis]